MSFWFTPVIWIEPQCIVELCSSSLFSISVPRQDKLMPYHKKQGKRVKSKAASGDPSLFWSVHLPPGLPIKNLRMGNAWLDAVSRNLRCFIIYVRLTILLEPPQPPSSPASFCHPEEQREPSGLWHGTAGPDTHTKAINCTVYIINYYIYLLYILCINCFVRVIQEETCIHLKGYILHSLQKCNVTIWYIYNTFRSILKFGVMKKKLHIKLIKVTVNIYNDTKRFK